MIIERRTQLKIKALVGLIVSAGIPVWVHAAEPVSDASVLAEVNQVMDKGLAYLQGQQKPDGGWHNDKEPPAITALVLKSFVQNPRYSTKTDFIRKGYDRLLTYQLESGGIYRDSLANYNTAIAVSALVATKDPEFTPAIDKAAGYLKGLQWTVGAASGPKGETVKDDTNPWYGGFGYGGLSRGGGRPDMSNTQMTLDALHDSGLKADDPAYQAALKFVSRSQNRSESNDQPWAGDDGGFVYGPSLEGSGESFAGEYKGADGRRMLRSYGSMTYAGIKSFIFAGLSKDDPRVKAAFAWVSKNWTLDENPGLQQANPQDARKGLFYYYHTMARALHEYGQPVIVDSQGKEHDWRVELIAKLHALQKPDGSWSNEHDKWMEGNPVLVTSYCVMALEEATRDLAERPAK